MYITKDKNHLEKKCCGVYYTEGLKIGQQLLRVSRLGKYNDCIGLAHNQIGGNKNVFVVKMKNGLWRVFINAEIVSGIEKFLHSEGCMSFPNKYNKVFRYNKIILKYQVQARSNSKGDAFQESEFVGMESCIIQHEIDHLNGIHIFNKKENK